MIEQNATVVAIDGDGAWVETQRHSACGACAMNKGCGAGLFAKAFGFAAPRLRVVQRQGITVGDQVVIGIDERALVRGSFAVYMMPILFMLGFAVLGEAAITRELAVQSEWLTLLSGVSGFAVGLWWLRGYTRRIRYDERYQPVIVKKVDAVYFSSACIKSEF